MEIQTSKLDASDPFGQLRQRLAQAESVLQQMPAARQKTVVDAVRAQGHGIAVPRGSTGPVTMAAVPVRDWDGGSDALPRTGTALVPVIRPRRIRVKLPWWWPWFLAAERIDRRLRRWWQKHVQRQSHRQRQGQGPRRR